MELVLTDKFYLNLKRFNKIQIIMKKVQKKGYKYKNCILEIKDKLILSLDINYYKKSN